MSLDRPFVLFLSKGAFETNVGEGRSNATLLRLGHSLLDRQVTTVAFLLTLLAITDLACCFIERKMEDQTALEKGVPFYSSRAQRLGDSSARLHSSLQGDGVDLCGVF